MAGQYLTIVLNSLRLANSFSLIGLQFELSLLNNKYISGGFRKKCWEHLSKTRGVLAYLYKWRKGLRLAYQNMNHSKNIQTSCHCIRQFCPPYIQRVIRTSFPLPLSKCWMPLTFFRTSPRSTNNGNNALCWYNTPIPPIIKS